MQVMREIVLPDNEAIKKLESFLKKEFAIGYVRKLFRKNGVSQGKPIRSSRSKPLRSSISFMKTRRYS